MRNNDERTAEVKRRIAERQVKKIILRRRIAAAFGAAVSLALVICTSFFMPEIIAKIKPNGYSAFETAASIFNGNAALGYIVTGVLAFVLGVCVTVLCFRIRRMNSEEENDESEDENDRAD